MTIEADSRALNTLFSSLSSLFSPQRARLELSQSLNDPAKVAAANKQLKAGDESVPQQTQRAAQFKPASVQSPTHPSSFAFHSASPLLVV